MTNEDMDLVREYAVNQSEQAFKTLTERHIGLVYSAALRQVRDPGLAEEVTQTVFIILARKAASLSPKTILSGWLYRTAGYASSAALKIQRRRERREQEAYMQAMIQETQTDSLWQQLSPLLDEGMAQLRQTDRDALVLRYFENKSLRDIGLALGVDEYAAQKRVARALDKLRAVLAKKGAIPTTAILGQAISINSIQTAPVALAKTITVIATTKSVATAGSTLTLVKGALKAMAWTKTKIVIVSAAAAFLIVGGATTAHFVNQHQHAATGNSVLRASWTLVGYADPESAFKSAMSAMVQGNAQDCIASLAPGGMLSQDAQGKSDDEIAQRNTREMTGITSYRILGKQIISANEVILTVKPEGPNGHGTDPAALFVIQKVGPDWKLAGPVKNRKNQPSAPRLQLDPNRPSRLP